MFVYNSFLISFLFLELKVCPRVVCIWFEGYVAYFEDAHYWSEAVGSRDVIVGGVSAGSVLDDDITGGVNVNAAVVVGNVVGFDTVVRAANMDASAITKVAVAIAVVADDTAVIVGSDSVADVPRGRATANRAAGGHMDSVDAIFTGGAVDSRAGCTCEYPVVAILIGRATANRAAGSDIDAIPGVG